MQAASGEDEGPHPQGNPPHPEIKIKAQTLGPMGLHQPAMPCAQQCPGGLADRIQDGSKEGQGVLHGLHQRQP